jgi:hypothetical protein
VGNPLGLKRCAWAEWHPKLPWLQLRKRSKFHSKFGGHLDPQLIKRKEGQMKKGVSIQTASKGIRMLKLVTWKKLSIILSAFIFGGTYRK